MHRTIRTVALTGAAFAAGLFVATSPLQGRQDGAPADEPSPQEKWSAYGTPGEVHEQLAKRVGTWKVASWMHPEDGGAPQLTQMTSTIEPMYGGRYFVERLQGEFLGEPFEGFGIVGYNNVSRRYNSIWMDSMSTGIEYFTGFYSVEDGGVIWFGNSTDPVVGGMRRAKIVTRTISDDEHSMTLGLLEPTSGEYGKSMEMFYTRVEAEEGHGDHDGE